MYITHNLTEYITQAKKYAELRQTLDCTWSMIKKVPISSAPYSR